MKNETNEPRKESGLPDIFETGSLINPLIIVTTVIVLIAIISMHFYSKRTRKPANLNEETYTTQSDSLVEPKKAEPIAKLTAPTESPAQQVSPVMIQQQVALIQEKQKELQQRLAAPLMLMNANQSKTITDTPQQTQPMPKDVNTQFMNQVSAQGSQSTNATTIGPLNSVIGEGNFIHAILESASNSDLPGYLRASVSEPVYSEDGTQVLIQRGSRLIGQYKSGLVQGQSRIFIVWMRLITPSGISIQLGSPGVDDLGVAGMGADEVNRHFWERFGTASLLSLIGAGAANIGVNGGTQENSMSSYRAAVASSFAQSANQSLQQESMIAPTLKTYQGKRIMVFVAKDLYFANVMKQIKPKINIF